MGCHLEPWAGESESAIVRAISLDIHPGCIKKFDTFIKYILKNSPQIRHRDYTITTGYPKRVIIPEYSAFYPHLIR